MLTKLTFVEEESNFVRVHAIDLQVMALPLQANVRRCTLIKAVQINITMWSILVAMIDSVTFEILSRGRSDFEY